MIDIKDRKILYELDKDARTSFSQIGKKTGMSTEVVHYRVKKLEEKGIITGYMTTVDYFKLGLIQFKICLKFNGIGLDVEEEVYGKLKEIPNVIWIAKSRGDWDCIISCTVNDIIELDKIKDEVISIASKHISEKSISLLKGLWLYPRGYLVGETSAESTRSEAEVKVDETDLELLRILAKDSRKPVVDIVKEMGSTVKIISSRIKKLKKSGVVKQFRLIIDYDKLGIQFFKTFFYLKNPDKDRVKQLITELDMHPNVIFNLKVIGGWDLEPEFEMESKEEFQKLVQDLMNRYSDIVQRIVVLDIVKEYKFTHFYK